MKTTHMQLLVPETDSAREVVKYQCLEDSCINNARILTPDRVEDHVIGYHNASHLEVETTPKPVFRPKTQEN